MQALQQRLPTLFASGLFQVFTLVLLFIALLYGQRGLVLLALLVLAMFNGAFLWSRFSLTGLTSRLSLSRDRVFPGEPLILKAEATNNKYLPVWLQLAVSTDRLLLPPDHASPFPSAAVPADAPLHSSNQAEATDELLPSSRETLFGEGGLLWQQQAGWSWELKPQQRGIYSVGTLRLAAGDLFGFYKQEKNIPRTLSVIVYPRLVTLNDFAVPLQELYGAAGAKSPVVDPVYAVATRDYREGSPARFIHWKASVRQRRLQEKVFEPSAQQKILLALDVALFHRHKALQAFERTLEVAASLAVQLEQRGRAFGLVSNGSMQRSKDLPASLNAGGGTHQLLHLLEMLARLQPLPRGSMEQELLRIGSLSRGITCLYFTYGQKLQIGEPIPALLKRLHIPLIVVAADTDEAVSGPTSGPTSAGTMQSSLPLYNRCYSLDELVVEEVPAG